MDISHVGSGPSESNYSQFKSDSDKSEYLEIFREKPCILTLVDGRTVKAVFVNSIPNVNICVKDLEELHCSYQDHKSFKNSAFYKCDSPDLAINSQKSTAHRNIIWFPCKDIKHIEFSAASSLISKQEVNNNQLPSEPSPTLPTSEESRILKPISEAATIISATSTTSLSEANPLKQSNSLMSAPSKAEAVTNSHMSGTYYPLSKISASVPSNATANASGSGAGPPRNNVATDLFEGGESRSGHAMTTANTSASASPTRTLKASTPASAPAPTLSYANAVQSNSINSAGGPGHPNSRSGSTSGASGLGPTSTPTPHSPSPTLTTTASRPTPLTSLTTSGPGGHNAWNSGGARQGDRERESDNSKRGQYSSLPSHPKASRGRGRAAGSFRQGDRQLYYGSDNSGRGVPHGENELVDYFTDNMQDELDYDLNKNSAGGFSCSEMYKVNRKITGLDEPEFDEHQYTSVVPDATEEERAKAEKLAREIEANQNQSTRDAESRGDEMKDEEAAFSSVQPVTSSSEAQFQRNSTNSRGPQVPVGQSRTSYGGPGRAARGAQNAPSRYSSGQYEQRSQAQADESGPDRADCPAGASDRDRSYGRNKWTPSEAARAREPNDTTPSNWRARPNQDTNQGRIYPNAYGRSDSKEQYQSLNRRSQAQAQTQHQGQRADVPVSHAHSSSIGTDRPTATILSPSKLNASSNPNAPPFHSSETSGTVRVTSPFFRPPNDKHSTSAETHGSDGDAQGPAITLNSKFAPVAALSVSGTETSIVGTSSISASDVSNTDPTALILKIFNANPALFKQLTSISNQQYQNNQVSSEELDKILDPSVDQETKKHFIESKNFIQFFSTLSKASASGISLSAISASAPVATASLNQSSISNSLNASTSVTSSISAPLIHDLTQMPAISAYAADGQGQASNLLIEASINVPRNSLQVQSNVATSLSFIGFASSDSQIASAESLNASTSTTSASAMAIRDTSCAESTLIPVSAQTSASHSQVETLLQGTISPPPASSASSETERSSKSNFKLNPLASEFAPKYAAASGASITSLNAPSMASLHPAANPNEAQAHLAQSHIMAQLPMQPSQSIPLAPANQNFPAMQQQGIAGLTQAPQPLLLSVLSPNNQPGAAPSMAAPTQPSIFALQTNNSGAYLFHTLQGTPQFATIVPNSTPAQPHSEQLETQVPPGAPLGSQQGQQISNEFAVGSQSSQVAPTVIPQNRGAGTLPVIFAGSSALPTAATGPPNSQALQPRFCRQVSGSAAGPRDLNSSTSSGSMSGSTDTFASHANPGNLTVAAQPFPHHFQILPNMPQQPAIYLSTNVQAALQAGQVHLGTGSNMNAAPTAPSGANASNIAASTRSGTPLHAQAPNVPVASIANQQNANMNSTPNHALPISFPPQQGTSQSHIFYGNHAQFLQQSQGTPAPLQAVAGLNHGVQISSQGHGQVQQLQQISMVPLPLAAAVGSVAGQVPLAQSTLPSGPSSNPQFQMVVVPNPNHLQGQPYILGLQNQGTPQPQALLPANVLPQMQHGAQGTGIGVPMQSAQQTHSFLIQNMQAVIPPRPGLLANPGQQPIAAASALQNVSTLHLFSQQNNFVAGQAPNQQVLGHR